MRSLQIGKIAFRAARTAPVAASLKQRYDRQNGASGRDEMARLKRHLGGRGSGAAILLTPLPIETLVRPV
jgi:hypothetical protein